MWTRLDRPDPGLSAVQLLVLSFLSLIVVGTLGLLVLPGLYTGPRLGIVDALFTATSAVCVTGLIVVDTATYFTPLGQAWIALLIQLGGLGIITFAALLFSLIGHRPVLSVEDAARSGAAGPRFRPGRIVRSVVAYTLAFEAVGAIALWLVWAGPLGPSTAIWPALFHAVSAYCNAGFSVFSDSLVWAQRRPATLAIIGSLIVVGGLGVVVLEDVRLRLRGGARRRFSVHTILVVAVTGVLIVGGTLLYLVFEAENTLRALPTVHRITNSAFMAVTARTAGFNTVDYDLLANPSLFLTIMLMIIGGSPGSTAGGIKTTTAALLVIGLVSWLRGRRSVSIRGRTIPAETLSRAAGIVVGAIAVLGISVFVMLVTELPADVIDRLHFMRVVFEAHSAFGTVGLSMGPTRGLSPLGEVGICLLMFLGRLGPLTIVTAMALTRRRRHLEYRYGHEEVIVG